MAAEDTEELRGLENSPLIYGKIYGVPGDIVTQRLYFLVSMTKKQIDFLNTPLLKTKNILINMWSITHLNWGILVGLLHLRYPKIFNVVTLIAAHTLFEIWELWAFGYFTTLPLTFAEMLDVISDTIFALLGYFLAVNRPYLAAGFFIVFNMVLLAQ